MKTLPIATPDFFACTRLHARMQRSSCRTSYRHANPRSKPGPGRGSMAVYTANPSCRRCPTGAAHAAGENSAATVEPLVPLRSKKAWTARRCKGCGAPMPYGRKSFCSNACANDSVRGFTRVDAVEELGGW